MALSHQAIPSSVRPTRQEAPVSRAAALSVPKPFLVSVKSATAGPKPVARADAAGMFSSMAARTLRLPQEPEDAKLTGATRSLDRRLLGLNLGGSLMRPAS